MTMTFESWALFAATEAAMSLSPGPAVMMVVAYGIARGWRKSLFVSLGILSGNAIFFALSATGLGGALLASPMIFMGIKYLGAAYLVYLGLSAIFGRPSPITLSRVDGQPEAGKKIFSRALMLQLTNPKSMLTFVAILTPFINAGKIRPNYGADCRSISTNCWCTGCRRVIFLERSIDHIER